MKADKPSRTGDAIRRRERLLVALANFQLKLADSSLQTRFPLKDALSEAPDLQVIYGLTQSKEISDDDTLLLHDMTALHLSSRIDFRFDGFNYEVAVGGLDEAREYEKHWLRRLVERDPATWCLAVFALFSLLVSVLALVVATIALFV